MSYRVCVRNPKTIDVRRIYAAVAPLGFDRQDTRAAEFLSRLRIDGRTFSFDVGTSGIRIRCPMCERRCLKIVSVEGQWACRVCNVLAAPSRCRPPLISAVEVNYLRPLRLLIVQERRLARPGLTRRQKAIIQNKVSRLRYAISEYICELYDEGHFPVSLPEYFEAFQRVI